MKEVALMSFACGLSGLMIGIAVAQGPYSHDLETPFGGTQSRVSMYRPPRPRLEGILATTPPRGELPRSATLRIGPFYSNIAISQSIGYRYTASSGTGTDLLYDNNRGEIKEDGSEFPLYTTLNMDNHAVLTRYADARVTINAENLYFPLDTQEDEFNVFVDAGAGGGAEATARMGFLLGEHMYGNVYDRIAYRVDYRDSRGNEDRYGGQKYGRIQNVLGSDLVWDMDKDQFMRFDVSRSDTWPVSGPFDDQNATLYTENAFYANKLTEYLTVGGGVRLSQTLYDASDRGTAYRSSAFLAADTRLTEHSVASAELGYSWTGVDGAAGFYGDEEDRGSVVGLARLGTRLSKHVSHWLHLRRAQDAGFVSASDVRDEVRYEVSWIDTLVPGKAYTEYMQVDPGNPNVTDYTTWTSGVDLAYRLSKLVTLDVMSSYTVQNNSGQLGEVQSSDRDFYDELLETENYNTWVSRIGTSFSLHPKVGFRTYYKHVARSSDDERLDYTRDIFEAVLTFRHNF